MYQEETVGDLDQSMGYALKQVQTALHNAMAEVLRPLDLSVAQYACMELLGQQPGLSNSELARRAFVTRQSMSLVLRRLQARGLVTRPDKANRGRTLPTKLTHAGESTRHEASIAARAVEKQLLSPVPPARQRQMREDLAACSASVPGHLA